MTDDDANYQELQRCLKKLASGLGVRRDDLVEQLRGDLRILRQFWGIGADVNLVEARKIVMKRLLTHRLIPGSAKRKFVDTESRDRYLNAVGVVFNIAEPPKTPDAKLKTANLHEMTIQERREWMDDGKLRGYYVPALYQVSLSSSYRHFVDAVKQIAEQLSSGSYKFVVPDEPQPLSEAVGPDRAHTSAIPPSPHFTPADLEALSRIAALPPRTRIRTHKGFLGSLGVPTMRRHAAVATRVVTEIDLTLRDNPAVTGLAKKDSTLAIVALSGGTRCGVSKAGREILDDYDGYDAKLIMVDASVHLGMRSGRRNAAAALKLLARRQSPVIGPGRLDIVARGVLRLTGRNLVLAAALYDMYQEESRAHGRVDLGGKWHDRGIFEVADWATSEVAKAGGDAMAQLLVSMQSYADLTVLDGVRRTKPIALLCGHPHQLRSLIGDDSIDDKDNHRLCVGALERMLKSFDINHRFDAAVVLLEMRSVISRANASSRDLFFQFCRRYILDADAADFDQQVANLADITDLTAELQAKMRT